MTQKIARERRSTAISRRDCVIGLSSISAAACLPSVGVLANGCPPREGDEYWEVSTRGLACAICPPDFDIQQFATSQFDCNGWRESAFADLMASYTHSPGKRTIVYTHGNWMTYSNARGRAIAVYRMVTGQSSEPLRFIAFTWPSHRDGRPMPDVREKAQRSEVDAFYFAHFFRQIHALEPLGLLGYSFGSRVTCGGLHLAFGGVLNRHCLAAQTEVKAMLRVSLVAPAFERNWLAPNCHYGLAMDGIEKLVNVYNSRDPILKRYRLLDNGPSPIAAGFAGLVGIPATADQQSTVPLQADSRIVQYDCRNAIGATHDEMTYYSRCPAFRCAIDNVLGK